MKGYPTISKRIAAFLLLGILSSVYLISLGCTVDHAFQNYIIPIHTHPSDHHHHNNENHNPHSSHHDDCCSDAVSTYFNNYHAITPITFIQQMSDHYHLSYLTCDYHTLLYSHITSEIRSIPKRPPPLVTRGEELRIFIQSFQI